LDIEDHATFIWDLELEGPLVIYLPEEAESEIQAEEEEIKITGGDREREEDEIDQEEEKQPPNQNTNSEEEEASPDPAMHEKTEEEQEEDDETDSEENMEQSFLLSSSINPEEPETIEYGDDETLQDLIDDEDYNPNGTCKAFLDSEGKGEPLDPKTPLSKLKGKTVYFREPPVVEGNSVILTSAANPDQTEKIEYGEEDEIQEFLEDEDFNPNGNLLAFLDCEGKGFRWILKRFFLS